MINEGRLHYIQSISNQSTDSFSFDVTNGISHLADLVFHFTVLPKTLYIETRDLRVTEGQEATLTSANIHVITDYYLDKINDFLIGKVHGLSVGPFPNSNIVGNGSSSKFLPRRADHLCESNNKQQSRVDPFILIEMVFPFLPFEVRFHKGTNRPPQRRLHSKKSCDGRLSFLEVYFSSLCKKTINRKRLALSGIR